jgi:putative CocE/NonD family hydrolase
MFPAFVSSTYYLDMGGTNGAFRLAHNLVYTLGHARRDRKALQNPVVDAWLVDCEKNVWEWFKKPLSKHIDVFRDIPMAKRWYGDWVEHRDFDEYWRQTGYDVEGYYDKFPDIPIHYLGGWFDALLRGTIKNYVELSKIHRSPTFLTMGPWCHGPVSARLTWQGDVDFGPESAVDWNVERLRFYDQFALGKNTGMLDEPRVRLFVMGGGDGRKNKAGRMNHGGRWRFEKAGHFPDYSSRITILPLTEV